MAVNKSTSLNVRERIAIHVALFILKIVKPFTYDHEFDKAIKPIEELVKRGLDD